ncbi:hypothetical protein [Catenuloplanes japonicus]|uniref:hypothetical protein n=1 Tax=Catenuloplanes japonicus TaxID=33876 RepID=UPI000523F31B|nr:hypothetical protein [Catenuloplanes japonicus]
MAEQYLTAYAVEPSAVAGASPVGKATLPGRHWDELTPAFRAWRLTALADLWSRPWPFDGDDDPWPFPMYADPDQVERISAELAAFDVDRVHEEYDLLPSGDDDAEEVAWLLEDRFPDWLATARKAGRGLYVLRDGGK